MDKQEQKSAFFVRVYTKAREGVRSGIKFNMMKKKVTRWYISNGTCSWFNNLYVKSQVFYGPEENSWDNSIWFDDEQKANEFKEELQNFINERYFNNRKKS